MEKDHPLTIVADKLEFKISHEDDRQEQFVALSKYIDDLIQNDFRKLLNILYKVDVSETRVKAALAGNKKNESPGLLIARLLIERETEKIKLRAKYRNS